MARLLLLLALAACSCRALAAGTSAKYFRSPGPLSTADCQERWLTSNLDHLAYASTFQQRYFTYTKFWEQGSGPIFFCW
jgi:hypothetical protein